jgi:hypothetical protein
VASAVNYGNIFGGTTGQGITLQALGSDANIPFAFGSKGSGALFFLTARDTGFTPQFTVSHTASAVNYLQVTGSATGGAPYLSMQGSDANIPFNLSTKGTGYYGFGTGGGLQVLILNTASAVNYLQVTGSATGNNVSFSAAGTDTNIGIDFASKGFGSLRFFTGGNRQFNIADTTSAVNYLQVTGAATGGGPVLSAQGSDANITNYYATKGTGFHSFVTGGNAQFLITNTASAVNCLQVTGAASEFPTLSAQGSSTNISVVIKSKGSGVVYSQTGGGTQFVVDNTASAVNWLQVTGAATGGAPVVSARGSDTNIDLALTPKGTGNVRFGTLTATSDVAITGFIEIKDSAGNVRKLAVIT